MINKGLEEFIKDEVKAFEERLRAKAEELQEQIDNNDNPKTIWDLDVKDRDKYYCLYSHGDIEQRYFNGYFDNNARDIGNAFLTIEEAEFELERRKIETIMRKYSRPFEEGDDSFYGKNYYIEFDIGSRTLEVKIAYRNCVGIPYFESKEIAKKVIDKIGEDRLIKYWFRVTE
ncbi:MAG: hypothetical protein ACTTKY_00220 [Catonella sp.]